MATFEEWILDFRARFCAYLSKRERRHRKEAEKWANEAEKLREQRYHANASTQGPQENSKMNDGNTERGEEASKGKSKKQKRNDDDTERDEEVQKGNHKKQKKADTEYHYPARLFLQERTEAELKKLAKREQWGEATVSRFETVSQAAKKHKDRGKWGEDHVFNVDQIRGLTGSITKWENFFKLSFFKKP